MTPTAMALVVFGTWPNNEIRNPLNGRSSDRPLYKARPQYAIHRALEIDAFIFAGTKGEFGSEHAIVAQVFGPSLQQ